MKCGIFETSRTVSNREIAPCKEIQDSLGLWIPCRGF